MIMDGGICRRPAYLNILVPLRPPCPSGRVVVVRGLSSFTSFEEKVVTSVHPTLVLGTLTPLNFSLCILTSR